MTDQIRFCSFTADGRHPAGVVVARWEVPGIGDLCNYHASEGWPELFTAPRTFTDPRDVDADLAGRGGPKYRPQIETAPGLPGPERRPADPSTDPPK